MGCSTRSGWPIPASTTFSPRRCRGSPSSGCRSGLCRRFCGFRVRRSLRLARRPARDRSHRAQRLLPNVDDVPASVGEIVAAARDATRKLLYTKLSPATTDIAEVARAAQAAGTDGLSLVNTILGLALDERTLKPRLSRAAGGLSGPGLKPIALAAVYDCSRQPACRSSAWVGSPPAATLSNSSPQELRTSRSGQPCSPTLVRLAESEQNLQMR